MLHLHKISHDMNNIGHNIRKLREKKGFSQEFVAGKLGINQSTYGKLEKDASNITLNRLFKVAGVLDEDITTLLDIDKKNIFHNRFDQGNGEFMETIKMMIEELKLAYEKMIVIKDEQITFFRSYLEKK